MTLFWLSVWFLAHFSDCMFVTVSMLRFISGFLVPPSFKPSTPASSKGKEKEGALIETKNRKVVDLAVGSSLRKVGNTTRATTAASTLGDEPAEIDPRVLTTLHEHLSLPLIYVNESVTPTS